MIKFSMTATINTQSVMRAMSQAAPQAVNAAADVFADLERDYVPVLTGNLRDHIQVRPSESGPYYTEVVVAPAEDASNPYGFDPAYARRIEFGFAGTDSLGRVYNQPAQPYVRPAWDTGRQDALDRATEVLSGAVVGAA